MSKKNIIEIENYERWSASGVGLKASGNMSLICENQGEDVWKIVDYGANTHNATGHSSGMFSDEKETFDRYFEKLSNKTFKADSSVIEEIAAQGARLFKFIEKTDAEMQFSKIDGKLALTYSEHNVSMASKDSALYEIDQHSIIVPKKYINEYNINSLDGKKVKLGDVKIPRGFQCDKFNFSDHNINLPEDMKVGELSYNGDYMTGELQELHLPKNLAADKVSLSYVKDIDVSESWNVSDLSIRDSKNITIKNNKFRTLSLNDSANIVIGKDVAIEKMLSIVDTKNALLPTNIGETNKLVYSTLMDTQRTSNFIYLYNEKAEDRVLMDFDKNEKGYHHQKTLQDIYNHESKTSGVVKADRSAESIIAHNKWLNKYHKR